MPEKQRFEPQDNLTGQDFSFRENKEMSSAQANETFVVDARFNRSLGENGETLGFAKKQFSNDPQVQQARDDARAKAFQELNALASKPEVAQWSKDRMDLDGIDTVISDHTSDLARERTKLQTELASGAPDAGNVSGHEKEITRLEKSLQTAQAIKANPALEEARLIEVMARTESIRDFIKMNEQVEAMGSLCRSINNVTATSANLYDNQRTMEDPDVGGDRALLARAVASHEVDQILGLNVCAQEKFGQGPDGTLVGISVQCDGAGVRSQFGSNQWGQTQTCFLAANYADPKVQQGLYDLEALDYITGQVDRHQGNIFVDPKSGKVTGIDNDLAFPQSDRQAMLDREPGLKAKAVEGMPKMMHQDTAAKIAAINPADLQRKLESIRPPDGSPGLGAKEIAGAVQRLQELQAAIQNPGAIEIVPKFDDTTYQRSIDAQKQKGISSQLGNKAPNTSYIGSIENERDFTQSQIDSGDTLSKIRAPDIAGKAKLNPEYAAFKKMDTNQQVQFRTIQSDIAQLEDKLAATQKEAAKMERPGVKSLFSSLKHGGLNGTRQHLMQKESELSAELRTKMDQMRVLAAPVVVEQPKAGGLKVSVGKRMADMRDDKIHSVSDHSVGADLKAAPGPADGSVGAKVGRRQPINIGGTSSSTVRKGGGIGG